MVGKNKGHLLIVFLNSKTTGMIFRVRNNVIFSGVIVVLLLASILTLSQSIHINRKTVEIVFNIF